MNKRFEEAATQHLIDTESHKYNMPSTIEFQIRAFLAGAKLGYAEGRREMNEACAKLMDGAAEHHFKTDSHPAFDISRFDADGPCPEHNINHSYPGYAGHLAAQMAKVIRELVADEEKSG